MKKNISLLAVLALACLLTTSCHVSFKKRITRSNEAVAELDSTLEFERVVMNAPCNVKFVQSDKSLVKMRGAQSDLSLLKLDATDGTLTIEYNSRKGGKFLRLRDVGDMDVTLYSPDLIGMELRGAGQIEVDGLDTDTLDLELRGAGNMKLRNIICDELNAQIKGAGNIRIDSLTTQEADIWLKGVGNINVGFVNSGNVKCELKGVGNVKLHGTVEHYTSNVQGSGNIDVSQLKILK